MRKLIALAVLVIVVVGGGAFLDRLAVNRTDSTISSRIEHRFPGSSAQTKIDSSPFLLRLVASGTVEHIHVHVTGITQQNLRLSAVDVEIRRLRLSRSSLAHGSVRILGLSNATITVTLSFADLVHDTGSSLAALLGLADGSSGSIKAGASGVTVTFGPLSFTFGYSTLVPCVGSARISNRGVVLTCSTNRVPPAIASA